MDNDMLHNKNIKKISFISTIIVVAFISIIPIIVYLKVQDVDMSIRHFWYDDKQYDFFSFYKSMIAILLGCIAFILFVVYSIKTHFLYAFLHKYKIYLIPLGLFVVLSILSSVFSKYPSVAYNGFLDRYEGLFVILSYITFSVISIYLCNSKRNIKIIFDGLFISAMIIGIIGFLQFFSFDIFKTNFIKYIIFPKELYELIQNAAYTVDEYTGLSNVVYGTLYNPNTFGSYLSMVFPISLTFFMVSNKRYYKIFTGILCLIMFTNLLGCNSRGAYLGVAVSLLIILIFLRKQLFSMWRSILVITSCFIVITIIMNFQSQGIILNKLVGTLFSNETKSQSMKIDKIKDFSLDDGVLTTYCSKEQYKFFVSNNILTFQDESSGREVSLYKINEGQNTFPLPYNEGLVIEKTNGNFTISKGNSYINCTIIQDQIHLLNQYGDIVVLRKIESFGFNGMERFASSRGYIWSRSLPLIKNTIFLGHGPDTFAMYFPQDDYKGKINYMFDMNIIVDKPHNMYLQIAINTGLISLISLLFLFIYIIAKKIKVIQINNTDSFYKYINIALLSSTVGYLITMMFTDSTVSVSPVFWVLLGICIGTNEIKRKKLN